MSLMAIDIGTTHCKVGLFNSNGFPLKIVFQPMHTQYSAVEGSYFDPDELIRSINDLILEVLSADTDKVDAVGITSMAESGILFDKKTGIPVSKILPWFETDSQAMADKITSVCDPQVCYTKFGLKATYKASLTKILRIKEKFNLSLQDKIWLSVADFVGWWLTGNFQTDVSLACRTLAFRLDQREWDREWLKSWGLPEDLFPPAFESGKPMGGIKRTDLSLDVGTPVSICGHDHICAAISMGAVNRGSVFDSIGTAEILIGAMPQRPLTALDFDNGLLCGCHTIPDMGYWLGGISSSGGSIEWFRKLINLPRQDYKDLEKLILSAPDEPTKLLYYPYLLGSSSPHTQTSAKAAIIGLTASHTSADVYKAILEGTAFELEVIRRAGEKMSSEKITTLMSAGGGSRNQTWMQIKADVTGCDIRVAAQPEATLLGAAILTGIGNGIFQDLNDAYANIHSHQSFITYTPNSEKHQTYQDIFEHGYLAFQVPIRKYGHWVEQDRRFNDT